MGPRSDPQIVAASRPPELALMIVLAVAMVLGVFFLSRAAAAKVRVAELKSNFVASASDDLKTPLRRIQLNARRRWSSAASVLLSVRRSIHHQRRSQEAHARDSASTPRLLAHGSGPAPEPHGSLRIRPSRSARC